MKIILHNATQNIKGQVGSSVTHVARIIDSRPAGIPRDGSILTGTKEIQIIRNAVVHVQLRQIISSTIGSIPTLAARLADWIFAETWSTRHDCLLYSRVILENKMIMLKFGSIMFAKS
jgi:hypothetical protein